MVQLDSACFEPLLRKKNHDGQFIMDVVNLMQERLVPWLIDQGLFTMVN